MGITGITAFRNVARNLSPLVMLAIVSFFYTVQAKAGQVTQAWNANSRSGVVPLRSIRHVHPSRDLVALPPLSITTGTKYWIAVLGPNGVLKFREEGTWAGKASVTSAQNTLTALPSAWTTGTIYYVGPVSAYGVGY